MSLDISNVILFNEKTSRDIDLLNVFKPPPLLYLYEDLSSRSFNNVTFSFLIVLTISSSTTFHSLFSHSVTDRYSE